MAYSQKLTIFLFFTSIPAIMSLKCYIGTTVGNAGSTLQTCPAEVNTACSIVIAAGETTQSCSPVKPYDGCQTALSVETCFCTSDG